jgi:hypothetical protein
MANAVNGAFAISPLASPETSQRAVSQRLVLLRLDLRCFFRMLSRNQVVPVGEMGLVSRLFVSASFMVHRRFTMMFCSQFMVFSRHLVMLRTLVLSHIS